MKKSSIVLPLLILLFIWSCKTTTEDEEPSIELGSEEWRLQEASLSGRGVATIPGSPADVPVSIEGNGEDYDMTVNFNDMDKSISAAGSFVFDIDIIILGIAVQSEKVPIQAVELFSGTWEMVGDQLIISDNGETLSLEVEEFTDTRLKLSGELEASDIGSFEVDGLTVTETSLEVVLIR